MEPGVKLEIDDTKLDEVLEKVERLVELLREAQQIIHSFSGIEKSES